MRRLTILPKEKADLLLSWAIANVTNPEIIDGEQTGRFVRWYGVGVDMSGGDWRRWVAFRSEPITTNLQKLAAALDNCLDFNSVQIYRYPECVGFPRHADNQLFFGSDVTLLHLCRSYAPQQFSLLQVAGGGADCTEFLWGEWGERLNLFHGEAIKLDTRTVHGVPPIPPATDRVSIQFRNAGGQMND